MQQIQLVEAFERRGFVCVFTLGRYVALLPTDIVGKKVKDKATSLFEVSSLVLDNDLSLTQVEEIIDYYTAKERTRKFDASQSYIVLSGKKPAIPESGTP